MFSALRLLAVFQKFADAGIAVYSGDIVGHGKSEGHRALIESYTDAVSWLVLVACEGLLLLRPSNVLCCAGLKMRLRPPSPCRIDQSGPAWPAGRLLPLQEAIPRLGSASPFTCHM